MNSQQAPELQVAEWLNTSESLSLRKLRGKVVLIEAFQMLCPGCVSHGLPQAQRVAETFSSDLVQVIGLHSVFEHHQAQGTRAALSAFLHEYRIRFPVAIDAASADGTIPATMRSYQLRGTPSTILIDRQGQLRQVHFGVIEDLALGSQITGLLAGSPATQPGSNRTAERGKSNCINGHCALPDHEPDLASR